MIPQKSSLVEILLERAAAHPDQELYHFLEDGEKSGIRLSYSQLRDRATAIAAHLQRLNLSGKNAILLFPPGLDYIESFFACLLAGVVAVPAYPPDINRLERTLPRLLSVVRDCNAAAVLTTEPIKAIAQYLFTQAPELKSLEWLSTDLAKTQPGPEYRPFFPTNDSLAFIQYSSGSTGEPKGVMLTHRNLLHNLKLISAAFGVTERTVGVIWLPPYHDMGLIGGIIQPLYAGIPVVLMSPLDFLKKPFRWLQAISQYQGTHSGGPNFAFELCSRKVTPEEISRLNLSSWELAFCGAEPIHPETIEQFARTFAPAGFRREAFYPCYGLAEGTLIVSGGRKNTPPVYHYLNKTALQQGKVDLILPDASAKALVGCGQTLEGQKIAIVDPDSRRCVGDLKIGEIWIQGPSIARGYWNKPQESELGFSATISETGEGPFLRSGDLGYLDRGELFVTGRLKDLLIIRGQNHYPQDIEQHAETAHPLIRKGCVAAFTVESELEEKLAIAAEVDLDAQDAGFPENAEAIAKSVRQAISEHHELKTVAISLLKKGTLPKTSSGKVRRQTTRQQFLNSELEILWESRILGHEPVVANFKQPEPQQLVASSSGHFGKNQIQDWLIARLAERLGVLPKELSLEAPFSQMGLDSKEAVNLSGELEDYLGCKLAPTLIWKYPTIDQLAEYLANEACA